MIKCRNCEHEFEKGNFCPRCGTRVIPDVPQAQKPVEQQPVYEAPQPIEPPVAPPPVEPPAAPAAPAAQETPEPFEPPVPEQEVEYVPKPVEEVETNPYEQKYENVRPGTAYYPQQEAQPRYTQPVQQEVQHQEQPQQYAQQTQYQPVQQPAQAQPPQPYQYHQYAYAEPPRKGWSAGKIVALVASILVAAVLFFYGIPIGIMACGMMGEAGLSTNTEVDKTEHSITESVMIGKLAYSISDIKYTETFNNKKLDSGKTYLSLNVNIRNTDSEARSDFSEYKLYADNVSCKEYINPDLEDFSDATEIDPGKTLSAELTFIVPADASKITLSVKNDSDDSGNSKQITFLIDN